MTTLTTLDRERETCATCRHWFCYDDGEPAVVPADDQTASMLDAIFGPGQHLCANTRRQGHCRRYPPAYYPAGGWDDFLGDVDTVDGAAQIINEKQTRCRPSGGNWSPTSAMPSTE